MRKYVSLAVLAGCALAPWAVHAQVSVNPDALEQLTPRPAPHHPAAPRPAPPAAPPATAQRPATPQAPATAQAPPTAQAPSTAPGPAANQATAQPPAPMPEVPAAPPPVVVIPPPTAVPVRPEGPPPPVPVVADAPGTAAPIAGGVRVTFGTDDTNLNPATAAALKALAEKNRGGDAPITILAYAHGNPDDPSTPRRLSLARGLAARAVLLNNAIPSTRIYLRALGAAPPNSGPENRADVTTTPPTPAPKVAAP